MKNSIGLLSLLLLFLWSCEDEKETFVPLEKPEVEFSEFTDPRDSNVYKCITIGGQTWMAENLRYRLYGGSVAGCYTYDEQKVPYLTSAEVAAEMDSKALYDAISNYYFANVDGIGFDYVGAWDYMFYEYLSKEQMTYPQIIEAFIEGKAWPLPPYSDHIDSLYQEASSDAIIKARMKKANGLANYDYAAEYGYLYAFPFLRDAVPEGWRVPTDKDWQTLERNLGMQESELMLKEEWRGAGVGTLLKEGEEGIGFNAQLAGIHAYGLGLTVPTFMKKGIITHYWSSTLEQITDSTANVIVRQLNLFENGVLRTSTPMFGKGNNFLPAYSLRCIKKEE